MIARAPVAANRRGYSREREDRRRAPKRRKVRRCACGMALPPWRWGTCIEHENEGSIGGFVDEFGACICNMGAEDFPNGRSVCGVPCSVHRARVPA